MNEDIKQIIQEHKLDQPSRQRSVLYKRFYIINVLRSRRLTCVAIGELLNRNHTTIVHALKQHDVWWNLKDEQYIDAIAEIMSIVQPEEHRISKKIKFVTEVIEDGIVIRGKFTKQMLKDFGQPLNRIEISHIFGKG